MICSGKRQSNPRPGEFVSGKAEERRGKVERGEKAANETISIWDDGRERKEVRNDHEI